MAAICKLLRLMPAIAALVLLPGCGKKGPLIPPEALAPAPVTDLALAQKGERFQVSWSAPTKQEGGGRLRDLEGFLLFRRTVLPPAEDCEECPGAYAQLARIDLDYLQGVRRVGRLFLFDDHDLKRGKIYQYKLRSVSANGARSKDSNKVRHLAMVPPPAPVLEALSSGTGVVLAFLASPPAEGKLVGYNIYRTKKGGEMPLSPLNAAPVTGTTYEDKVPLVGVSYSYKVTSVAALNGESAESLPSNQVEGAIRERD